MKADFEPVVNDEVSIRPTTKLSLRILATLYRAEIVCQQLNMRKIVSLKFLICLSYVEN